MKLEEYLKMRVEGESREVVEYLIVAEEEGLSRSLRP